MASKKAKVPDCKDCIHSDMSLCKRYGRGKDDFTNSCKDERINYEGMRCGPRGRCFEPRTKP